MTKDFLARRAAWQRRTQAGVTTVEWVLLGVGVSIAAIVALTAIGNNLFGLFADTASHMGDEQSEIRLTFAGGVDPSDMRLDLTPPSTTTFVDAQIVVNSVGQGPVENLTWRLSGDASADAGFSVIAGSTCAQGQVLPSGSSCSLMVRLRSGGLPDPGLTLTGTLNVVDTENLGRASMALRGTVIDNSPVIYEVSYLPAPDGLDLDASPIDAGALAEDEAGSTLASAMNIVFRMASPTQIRSRPVDVVFEANGDGESDEQTCLMTPAFQHVSIQAGTCGATAETGAAGEQIFRIPAFGGAFRSCTIRITWRDPDGGSDAPPPAGFSHSGRWALLFTATAGDGPNEGTPLGPATPIYGRSVDRPLPGCQASPT